MTKLLVWCGGDVTRYNIVNYLFERGSKLFRHFISAGALFNYVKPDYLLVFIPEVLFEERHDEYYRLLIKAKAGWLENEVRYILCDNRGNKLTIGESVETEEFIKRLDDNSKAKLIKVPHPSEGDAISITCKREQDKFIVYVDRKSVRGSGNFNSIVNVMFYYLSKFIEEKNISEIHVDLTHGTNILVQALMLTSSMLRGIYDYVNIRLWTAPMLKPENVHFEEISSVLDICSKIMTTVNAARRWLDDRLVEDSLELFRLLGREIGPQFRDLFGGTKKLVEDFRDLCWILRSNQTTLTPKYVLSLHEKSTDIKEKAQTLIREYVERELWRKLEKIEDIAWIPVIYSIVRTLDQYLVEAFSLDPLEVIIKNLELMHRCKYYVQVLLTARELIILLLLIYVGVREIKVKGDLWKKLEDILLGKGSAEEKFEKIVSHKEFEDLKSEREFLVDRLIPIFDELKEFRNRFAHGFLVRDSVIRLGLTANWIASKREKIDVRRIGELESLSRKVLDLLKELISRIKSKRESELRQVESILTRYIDNIERSFREFREEFRLRS